MKTFKNILLFTYIIIELLAIVLFILKEISAKTFFLIAISMSLMIGLYFYNKNKLNNSNVVNKK